MAERHRGPARTWSAGARFAVRERRSTVGLRGRRPGRGAAVLERRAAWSSARPSCSTRATPAGHRRIVNAALARGDPRADLLFHLARLHLRWHRQGFEAAERIYEISGADLHRGCLVGGPVLADRPTAHVNVAATTSSTAASPARRRRRKRPPRRGLGRSVRTRADDMDGAHRTTASATEPSTARRGPTARARPGRWRPRPAAGRSAGWPRPASPPSTAVTRTSMPKAAASSGIRARSRPSISACSSGVSASSPAS